MRIGQGFDAHRFTEGSEITLGGVIIPHKFGIEAHSDGDVLLHAICDALLGAAGLGDIGKHYSDQDDNHENRDSREFVVDIAKKIYSQGLMVSNVDATVILQSPKVASYIDAMCKNIAQDLKLDLNAVNVKATTTEHMGFVGREEGIAALAVVLLR
ncbi:MAG: 2-C-methyl-D-erythritol 2,4-cyclodiphosphate synthase [Gammaproteobacteria bacterium]|nr:2-C-methyl-D-erythritol 2,4-cyclodiphosphate synthase [Gammaproteobacteria bacterium]